MDTDKKRSMFVCTNRTLITNVLLNKIKTWGAEPFYVHDALQIDTEDGSTVGSVVYYMDDDIGECAALHSALADFCARHDLRVVCVGSGQQYAAFAASIAPERVAGFFERPLNMESFQSCLFGVQNRTAQKKRVLIVDDDANYRQFVREWLKGIYDVSMANGGEQALKVLAAQKCDLVLLDYEMPVMSGPETLENILALPQEQRAPVIFLTGNEDEECIQRVLSLHPAGCLLKSVGKEEFLSKVADVLR